jgi:hypothetical protein
VRDNDWSHLNDVVDAFAAAGNAVRPPGFHPTQGGWVCEMTRPLDAVVAAACTDTDPRLTFQDDELSCSHCWPAIIGAEAQARYSHACEAAREQLARHATPATCPPG